MESLRTDNRWVKLAKFIPWHDFEVAYAKKLSGSGLGPPAKSVRIALGALIIKEKLGTSDEETVEQIRENPYLQYFLGFTDYCDDEPFHPTMFVHFRKRFGKKTTLTLHKIHTFFEHQAAFCNTLRKCRRSFLTA
jgi:IS5 family transposase